MKIVIDTEKDSYLAVLKVLAHAYSVSPTRSGRTPYPGKTVLQDPFALSDSDERKSEDTIQATQATIREQEES
ncbi:hypothetical protein [Streptomyces sp. NPDC055036]